MSFLVLCERAALLAQREAALSERQATARARGVAAEIRQLDQELAATATEKRIVVRLAVNCAEVGA